jgi:hypothetical protein
MVFTASAYVTFYTYFIRSLECDYPEQSSYVSVHVCLMSQRQTGNIKSFRLAHLLINNKSGTGRLSLGLLLLVMYFF